MAHLEPGLGQRSARHINRRAQALLAHGIATEIYWVPGHWGIPGNKDAVHQANLARDASRDTMIDGPYTSASNTAIWISEGRSAAKAKLEADKYSKHFSYRLKGRTGTRRPVLMTSVKSLPIRFYKLKCGHAPSGVYLKRFGHRENDKCWRCGGGGRTAAQTREHRFHHCSRWSDQQKTLWKAEGKTRGWKAGRCRHMQVSELFSMEVCNQAVMDFLAATEVGNFPPKWMTEWRRRRGWLRRGGRRWWGFISVPFCSFSFSLPVFSSILLLCYLSTFIYISGDEG